MAHTLNPVPGRLLRGEILSHWKQLTLADVEECGSDGSKLVDLVENRYGYAKGRAKREVELFLGDLQDRLRLAA
jgi:hypothetical protein